ncbi:armadillo-type protein [Pisolithus marmoratus]|nr:armadillo-type protein [Pisolithus marmoratus]
MRSAFVNWRVRQIQYTTRWLSLDNDTKAKVKQEVLVTLASPLSRAGGFFAQVIAAIASIELPHDQWPDLIELVSDHDTTNDWLHLLRAWGLLSSSSSRSLPHVLQGECNHIKQVVCEATQNSSVSVQVGAFEYLVKIMALYYDKMAFYMEQALFMATDYGEPPKIESKLFAKIALPEVIPILLSLLTLQEEVVDEGEWNISMSVGTCFNFMAQAVTDVIVDAVIPFIEAHIKSPDGHQREAAMMAFGSILDGPYPSILTHAATSRSAVCCQSITWRPGEGIQPMADCIMTLILQLVWAARKTSTVLEDTLVAVGSLASDSSIDLHMPLPTLSPNSKLLPQPSADSLNWRDTPRRQTRHRDEKLLKGGLASLLVWDGLLAPSDLLCGLHHQPSWGIPVMSFLVLPFTTVPATPAVPLDITQHPTGDGERHQVPFVVMMGIIGHGGTLLSPLQMSQTWLVFEDDVAHSHSVSVMLAYICHPCGSIARHAFISNCQGTTLTRVQFRCKYDSDMSAKLQHRCNSDASATPITLDQIMLSIDDQCFIQEHFMKRISAKFNDFTMFRVKPLDNAPSWSGVTEEGVGFSSCAAPLYKLSPHISEVSKVPEVDRGSEDSEEATAKLGQYSIGKLELRYGGIENFQQNRCQKSSEQRVTLIAENRRKQ